MRLLPTELTLKVVQSLKKCVSKCETRENLQVLRVEYTAEGMLFVATDGHALVTLTVYGMELAATERTPFCLDNLDVLEARLKSAAKLKEPFVEVTPAEGVEYPTWSQCIALDRPSPELDCGFAAKLITRCAEVFTRWNVIPCVTLHTANMQLRMQGTLRDCTGREKLVSIGAWIMGHRL